MLDYCTFIEGNSVIQRSKKQNVVGRSNVEAKFGSIAHGNCEVIWIKRLLEELKALAPSPIKVRCDNRVAIVIAHNPVLQDITKHIEVNKCFIKEKIDNEVICMSYIQIINQVADVLTKGLHEKQFGSLVS